MPKALISLHNWSGFSNLGEIFSTIINILLIFISVLSLASLIFGGYQYITSAGNPESAQKGKSSITWGIIGLVIAFASFVIVDFVYTALTS